TEEVATRHDVVRARRRPRRLDCGRGRRGRRRAAATGRQRRWRNELAPDIKDEQCRNGGERKIYGGERSRHHVFALPGGRMKPDTVSVARSSFGWLTFTTLTRKSFTVNSFCAPSTRASRSTS